MKSTCSILALLFLAGLPSFLNADSPPLVFMPVVRAGTNTYLSTRPRLLIPPALIPRTNAVPTVPPPFVPGDRTNRYTDPPEPIEPPQTIPRTNAPPRIPSPRFPSSPTNRYSDPPETNRIGHSRPMPPTNLRIVAVRKVE